MNTAQHMIVFAMLTMVTVANAQSSVGSKGSEVSEESAPAEQVLTDNPSENESEISAQPPSTESESLTESGEPSEEPRVVESTPLIREPPAESNNGKNIKPVKPRKDYGTQLYYDLVDDGVVLPPLELQYDATQDEGKSLEIGNVKLTDRNFYFGLLPLGKTHPEISKVLNSDERKRMTLLVQWPTALLENGKIEMISKRGRVLWQYDMTEAAKNTWMNKVTGWAKALRRKGVDLAEIKNKGLFAVRFGIDVENESIPLRPQKDSFRFCISQTSGNNSTRLCSPYYGVARRDEGLMMGKAPSAVVMPRVIVNSEEKKLKETLVVGHEMPVSFSAELKGGETYEFFARPLPLILADIADLGQKGLAQVIGIDHLPVSNYKVITNYQERDFIKMIGFDSTIYDNRVFWMTHIKKSEPNVYLRGIGGGVFKQRIQLENIPKKSYRVYLKSNTPKATYSNGIRLRGLKPAKLQIYSEENKVKTDPKTPEDFDWYFKATQKGKINKSYLTVSDGKNEYRAYYELYKGYSSEISGRFTGVQSSTDTIILGEIAFNHWFEDIFGWDQYFVSRQRWGVSAKYFNSLNDLTVTKQGAKEKISVLNVDLKYRLTPGIWTRDESVGLLASYQDVVFGKVKAPMTGAGVFWARSMPKVLDEIFNLVPLMRYPKWVDVEFIYYAQSLDSKVKLISPMSLNFHGKVLWGDNLFGEAGFGIKRYGFTDTKLNQKAELNTFYGTVGLGVNF